MSGQPNFLGSSSKFVNNMDGLWYKNRSIRLPFYDFASLEPEFGCWIAFDYFNMQCPFPGFVEAKFKLTIQVL